MDQPLYFAPGAVKDATKGMSSGDVWNVPRNRITVHPDFNVRDKDATYWANVRRIADSMKQTGYRRDRPITIFIANVNDENVVLLVDGHTRLDAFDLAVSEGASLEALSAITMPRGTSMEDLTASLVVSNDGERLTPMGIARVVKRMQGYGLDEPEIARRLGFTLPYIRDLLDLLATPTEVRNMVTEGQVSAAAALSTVRAHKGHAVEVLRAGKQEAEAKGKTKVTPKHIKAAVAKMPKLQKAKPEATKAEKAQAAVTESHEVNPTASLSSPLELDRGVRWIAQADAKDRDNFVALLAAVFDIPGETIHEMVSALE